MTRALAIAIALYAAPVSADILPDGYAVLLGSKHVNASVDFEERNFGIFATYDGEFVDTRFGAYRNSFGEGSVALTFASDHLTASYGSFNVGLFSGGAYYPSGAEGSPIKLGDGNILPLIGLEFTHDDAPLFVQLLPGDKELMGFDYLVSFGVRF